MSASPATKSGSSPFVLLFVCLVLVLVLFFRQSFSESQVLFANDAPLGQLKTQEGKGLSNFRGVWIDLNWIGFTQPSALPNISNGLYLVAGPVGFAKFYAPIALLILGLSAGLFFRQLGFGRLACILGGMAAMLNTDPFSYACWGLPSLTLCMASIFLALAALVSRPGRTTWLKAALAGLAVGFSITEGFDNGAIFSLYVAAFAFFQSWVENDDRGKKLIKGISHVAVIAICAALMAAQALSTLIGTQITGIVGTQQDAETRQMHWDLATAGSLPKIETLRVVIPGLFGYRMDTPEGGNYWGSAGQTPGIRESRHSGAGIYAGVLVVLIAVWACARSLVKQNNPFSDRERKFIWFWALAALISLLFAYGRHAPFYQFLYALPYFSTIRMPYKFMHPFTICLVTLFAYGLEGLARSCLGPSQFKTHAVGTQMKTWWKTATRFDRRWTIALIVTIAASLFAGLVYASSRIELIRYLQSVGFRKPLYSDGTVASIARFSFTEVGWFLFFLVLSTSAMLVVLSGALSGQRAKWAGMLLGLVLVTDFARADAPWIIYESYQEKYAPNPVIELLCQQPFEHRVAGRLSPLMSAFLAQGEFPDIYSGLWMQHLFPYYGVQCLDIIQMPRMPELDNAYLRALSPRSQTNLFPIARLWQLTNTRFQLGMTSFLELLNERIDPIHRSFRVATNFDFVPKSSASTAGGLRLEDITTALAAKGQHAIFELTNALPRAKLFSQWEINRDDNAVLAKLADPAFDPTQAVLLSDDAPGAAMGAGGNAEPGVAQITHYAAKQVQVKTQAKASRILLLNDKFHPDWKVRMDGQDVPLLRANFLMRAVHLPPGEHTVEFRFAPPLTMQYVSLTALVLALVLWGVLAFAPEKPVTGSSSGKSI